MTTVADVDLSTWNRYATSPRLRGSDPFGSNLISVGQAVESNLAQSISTGEWPDATTTGVPTGTTLTPSLGITTSVDGQVINALEITGTITVQNNNVTITNCSIDAENVYWGIKHNSGNNLIVTDCEIFRAVADGVHSTFNYSATYTRLHIHDCDDNMKMSGNQSLINSYIHGYRGTVDSHNDAIQVSGGDNIVFSGNRIDGPNPGTAAIFLKNISTTIDNITITNNRLSWGVYSLFFDSVTGFPLPTNVTVTNNTWEKDAWTFGPYVVDVSSITTWSGNVYTDGSTVVAPT